MISPYVRRQRLAQELRQLREAAELTHAQLAQRLGQSRMKITRSAPAMGARQALYADLEAGAAAIAEFQLFIPGLLQTPQFAHQRQLAETEIGPVTFSTQRAVDARQMRQRMLRRPEGPSYEVVLDEIAVRRLPAPPQVMAAQLEHLIALAEEPKITVRVLPVSAQIEGHVMPRSAFSLYTYPDPQDPQVVAVDTVTTDLVLSSLTEDEQVKRYLTLYERLRRAALSPPESMSLLTAVTTELTTTPGAA